jgi:hypothetical protein
MTGQLNNNNKIICLQIITRIGAHFD